MGLGTARGPWEDYEWFDSLDLDGEAADVASTLASLEETGVWRPGTATRVLLVDLDNVRVATARLRSRVSLAVALARQADVAVFAGQRGSVDRARPALQEYAVDVIVVGNAPNAADVALLEIAGETQGDDLEFVVISNDGIFARLAMRGPLTVLSPGAAALSDQLADAAERVIDLRILETAAGAA